MEDQPTLFDMSKFDKSEPNRESGGNARLQKACRNQVEIKMACLDELLTSDHKVRRIWEYVESLDLSKHIQIKSVEGNAGRPAIDPKILVALWLYATVEGIGSAHVLAQYTKEHIAFQWICGGVPIERRTISQFRTDNGELFDDLLTQGITILMKAGAIQLEEIAQDGLRVRAAAGKGSFRREKSVDELHILAKERVRQLKEELEANPSSCKSRQEANKKRAAQDRSDRLNKAKEEFIKYEEQTNSVRRKHKQKLLTDEEKQKRRISTTDPEARVMKMSDGGFRPAYNFQFGVDTSNNIIVNADVTNCGTDGGLMLPMYKEIKKKFKKTPQRYLADGGFKSSTDIETMTKEGCKAFVPVQANSKKGQISDPYKHKHNESKEMGEWRVRMSQEDSKIIYKKRASTIELVNANLRNWGLYQVGVRGLTKVKKIACMFAVAYNMMRTLSLGIV